MVFSKVDFIFVYVSASRLPTNALIIIYNKNIRSKYTDTEYQAHPFHAEIYDHIIMYDPECPSFINSVRAGISDAFG